MSGQIIIVNGTSGSGKSTTCERFVQRAEDFWLTSGIDHFLGANFPKRFGHHGDDCQLGFYAEPERKDDPEGPLRWRFGPEGMRAFAVFHEWLASASREGCNIIVDHLLMLDPPLLQDCIWRLSGLPVLLVNLKPPYEVLEQRIAQRQIGQRFANSQYDEERIKRARERLDRLRPWFYRAVYASPHCDLEIDSADLTPDEICSRLEQRLSQGPGSAFDTLMGLYRNPITGH